MSNINNFIDDTGKIKSWPSKHDFKFQVLEYLANKFEYNYFYREKEVNNIIESYHTFNDYFLLRRGLIESKLLSRTRNGAKYWRPDNSVDQDKIMICKFIEANYGIGSIINIVKVINDADSICYDILTDKGEFILKNIGVNNTYNEAKLYDILESEDIPVFKLHKQVKTI